MLYKFGKFIFFVYYNLLFRVRVEGAEHIPAEGAVILCSNHTSNNDPLLLGAFIKRPIHFMAKSELFRNAFMRLIMRGINTIPTNRNAADMASYRGAMAALESNCVLGIFAQGKRVAEADAKDAKAGVALFALKSGATVIPVKISSRYRPFGKLTIKIGAPVDLSAFRDKKTRSDTLREAAEVIFGAVVGL